MQKPDDKILYFESHACFRYHDALLFPLSDIFPKMFFLKELDHHWISLFHDLYDEDIYSKWNQNLNTKKLEVLIKSSLHYLDHHEKEAIFLFHLRSFFKDIKYDHIGLKDIVSQSKNLLRMAERWEKEDDTPSAIRSLGQSYLLFIMTLNNSVYTPLHQRKVLSQAFEYGQKAKRELNDSNHPYFGLLFCLINIAAGQWNQGTKELHALAQHYPDPKLFHVLSKLYIKIGLPNVAKYFEKKLNHLETLSSTDLNSDFKSLENCA